MINKTNKFLVCFPITKYKREMTQTIAHRYENDNRE